MWRDVLGGGRGREGEVVDGDGMWTCDAGWIEWRRACVWDMRVYVRDEQVWAGLMVCVSVACGKGMYGCTAGK
jgi:hypothetical protein